MSSRRSNEGFQTALGGGVVGCADPIPGFIASRDRARAADSDNSPCADSECLTSSTIASSREGPMSKYKIRVKPRDERFREIELRALEAQKVGHVRQEFKFRSGKEALPLVTVPVDYPLYRLENYRTRDHQLSLVAEGKFDTSFFDPGRREDPSVQQAQHELLIAQAKRGSGGTIKPIYDELERVKEQTDYLIITRDGVVVNGNRRLAAMRELVADDAQMYASFANVQCAVLPASATPPEILELEIGLQMQPDTKLPYEWTALGRAARDLRARNVPEEKIAALMNRDLADVQRAITMIDAADMYLAEWLRKPDSYSLLDGTEQAFKQVAARNWGREEDAELRETTRKFDFFVIEHRDVISERAYDLINRIEQNPRDFLNQLAVEWDVTLPKRAKQPEDLEITFEDGVDPSPDYSVLSAQLLLARNDKEDARRRMESVAQVCEIVGEQAKEKGKAALKFARSAFKALNAIDLRASEPATWGDLYSLLQGCENRCQELVADINSRRGR
jgi:hypothetical protein